MDIDNEHWFKTYEELGYMDVDEAYDQNGDTNPHHFHHYDSGMKTYKKEYIHLYKKGANE